MRQPAGFLLLLIAFVACAPTPQTAAERRAEAARADSSAAGYDVGVANRPAAGPSAVSTQAQHTDSTTDSSRRSGGRGAPTGTPTGPVNSTATLSAAQPPTTRVDSTRPRGGRGGEAHPVVPTPAVHVPLDPAIAAMFLVFDETKKTATFQLAADTGAQVSFNGASRGARILTIPVGWRLNIEFTNRDGDLPHSATVVASFEPIPEELPPAAFPEGHTAKVEEGMLDGDSDAISFVADRAGRYIIACGVLGHAQRGQWLILDVSQNATVPSYR